MLYKNFKTRNIFNCSNNSLLVCSVIEFKTNIFVRVQFATFALRSLPKPPHSREFKRVIYFFVKFMVENKMLNLQNGSEERKMPNIHGWICAVVSRFRFHIRHQTKHVRQCLPKIWQIYNGVSILNIGQSLGNDGQPVTNVKNWAIIFTTSVAEWNCNVTVAEWYKRQKQTALDLWPRMVQWLAFQTVKRKAGDRVTSWLLLTFFFLILSLNWIDFSFLYVKDTLVHIECEAGLRPRMPIFYLVNGKWEGRAVQAFLD